MPGGHKHPTISVTNSERETSRSCEHRRSWATDLEFVARSSPHWGMGGPLSPPGGCGAGFLMLLYRCVSGALEPPAGDVWQLCLSTDILLMWDVSWSDRRRTLFTTVPTRSLWILIIDLYLFQPSLLVWMFPVLSSCQTFKWWTLDRLLIMKHLTVHYYPFMF